jgi:hypothetical protein
MIRRHNAKIKNDNPNNNNKNKSNEQSLDVMNYLIQKLESRQKKIFKYKNLLEELDSFETFYSKRKEIYLLLNNLEEDLKQASFAIKALMLQNKSLIKDINTKLSENKILSNKLNLTIGENQNMKVKLENINKKENQFNEMVNYDINNNSNNNLINVDINSIKVDEEGEYDEPKIKNINLKYNKSVQINNNNYENEKFNKEYTYDQFSNVKNIMAEMRNNKKNLKKIIEAHLKEQDNNNENIS